MKPLLRSSAAGAIVGGVAFAGLGMYMNSAIGAGPFDHPGPLGFTAAIGATIGGLVAPLFRRAFGRDASHQPSGTEGDEGGAGDAGDG